LQVHYHDDCFPQNAKDEEWLPVAGQNCWLVLTNDKNIRRSALAREALEAARVRLFVLSGGGNRTGAENAALIFKQRSRIERGPISSRRPWWRA
jgi:hypothetical protein